MRASSVIVEAEAVQAARPEVLDQHVRPTDQPADDFPTFRLAKVQAQAALVAVDRHEVGRHAIVAAADTHGGP